MVQGVLAYGEDEFRHSSFDFIQIFIAGLFLASVFFIYLLVPCLKSNQHSNERKSPFEEKTPTEQDDKAHALRESKATDSTESKIPCKKRSRYMRFQKRRKRKSKAEENVADKQRSLLLKIIKLFSDPIKRRRSYSWKKFKRKHKPKRFKKHKKIRKNSFKKKQESLRNREHTLRTILSEFLYSILFSVFKVSNNKPYFEKFKPYCTEWMSIPRQCLDVLPVKGLDNFFQAASTSAIDLSERMRYEWLRFLSFAGHRNIPVRPMFLARSGFYAAGNNSSDTTCFSCGLNHTWREGEDPGLVHRVRSPNCLHVSNGDPRNIPIHQDVNDGREDVTSTEETQSERRRVSEARTCDQEAKNLERASRLEETCRVRANDFSNSIRTNTESRIQSHSLAVANGNPEIIVVTPTTSTNTVPNDTVNTSQQSRNSLHISQTSSDSLHISQDREPSITEDANVEGQPRHNASTETSSPDRARSTLQSQIANTNSTLGINFNRPRYPAYAVLSVRISSFQGWSALLTQTPRQMAIAGFFYVGYSDYGRCFFCGGGLRNWEIGDDPWVEHARWFPRCAFLRQNKGNDFVDLVQEEYSRSSPREVNSSTDRQVENGEYLAKRQQMVTSLLEMGYNKDDVETVINECTEGSQNLSIEYILDKLDTKEQRRDSPQQTNDETQTGSDDQPTNADLARENRRLRLQRLCRICEEVDATIALLPCGHLICCPDCAPAMRKCPLCKEFVRGTIKTYLV